MIEPRRRPAVPEAPARDRGRSGFTLLELLIAMALLATLGTFLVRLLSQSFDLYKKGDQRGDLYQNSVQILEMLDDDLLAVHSGPDGRLVLQTEVLGKGKGRGDGFLLRLVRTMHHGEREHPVLRRAGTKVLQEGKGKGFEGVDPGPEGRAELAPPSGLEEVCYALLPDVVDGVERPGIMTLYRGVHAPAFEGASFFASLDGAALDPGWINERLKPVATDILGLWILCMSQLSEEWGEDRVMEEHNPAGQSCLNWDSTRGILPASLFPLARGEASVDDARDDVYPREIRIILQVGRGSREDAVLRTELRPDDTIIRVNNNTLLPGEDDEDRYVKVGSEWLWLIDPGSSDIRIKRQVRHTKGVTAAMPAGTPVYYGKTFRQTLAMPARRSYWVEGGK